MKWFLKCLKNYATFNGRAGRTELWYFMLYWSIFYVVIIAFDRFIGGSFLSFKNFPLSEYIPLASFYDEVGILTFLYRPLTIIPSLAVISRRLHDINKSGWWCLTCITPAIVILFFYLCKKGDDNKNQYGLNPLD